MRFACVIRPAFAIVALLSEVAAQVTNDDGGRGKKRLLMTKHLGAGTGISVDITSPSSNCMVFGSSGEDVPVEFSGTAEIGAEGSEIGGDIEMSSVVYVVDVSASTKEPAPGCSGDENGDGQFSTVLDCMIRSVRMLNDDAIQVGTVENVGLVSFASKSETLTTNLIPPGQDEDGDDEPDVMQLARELTSGGMTSFRSAVGSACDLLDQSANSKNIVIFVSDGYSCCSMNQDVTEVLPCNSAIFETFAVGPASSCDNTGTSGLSLASISDRTGGVCKEVPNLSMLPDVIGSLLSSKLLSVSILRTSMSASPVTVSHDPLLPIRGPAVSKFRAVVGVPLGEHEVCVTAQGMDSRGTGSTPPLCRKVVAATIAVVPDYATGPLTGDGQTHTVHAEISAPGMNECALSGTRVYFYVGDDGPNAGASGVGEVDSTGRASFTYPVKQNQEGGGTDVIHACLSDPSLDGSEQTHCSKGEHRWFYLAAPDGAAALGPLSSLGQEERASAPKDLRTVVPPRPVMLDRGGAIPVDPDDVFGAGMLMAPHPDSGHRTVPNFLEPPRDDEDEGIPGSPVQIPPPENVVP